jgi:hypothetical protein
LNWSVLAGLSLNIVGRCHVAPPSSDRANQIRDLHIEAAFPPGSSDGTMHPGAPVRSVQTA